MSYFIRPFRDISDHEQCVAIQAAVWGGPFVVPVNMTVTLQRHGGIALGAFEPSPDGDRMIGFVIGFLSPTHHPGAHRGLSHHSHIAAVLPDRQGRGVGEALIGKLGCICRTYIRNAYGDMRDALNAGLPSDRFEVEWWLDRAVVDGEHRMANGHLVFKADQPALRIAIPRDFQALKRADGQAALRWRMEIRARFEEAFAQGYAVVDFALEAERGVYTLVRLSG